MKTLRKQKKNSGEQRKVLITGTTGSKHRETIYKRFSNGLRNLTRGRLSKELAEKREEELEYEQYYG